MARSDWRCLYPGTWRRKDKKFHAFKGRAGWYVERAKVGGKRWLFDSFKGAMDYADKHYPMEREG